MQFGKTLNRVLTKIVEADPRHGPVNLIKIDVADGFYRIHLSPHQIPALGVAIPPGPDGKALVAFPLVLPMGWVESPPLFCAATKTIADLANASIQQGHQTQPHRLRNLANTTPADSPSVPIATPKPNTTSTPLHPLGP
jgi:hypothetical protein